MIDEAAIRLRWETVGARLDERGRRLFAAVEARALVAALSPRSRRLNRWMAATLDGFVNELDAVFQAKFMLPARFPKRRRPKSTPAPTQHVGDQRPISGRLNHHRRRQMGRDDHSADALYQHFLVTAERRFWRCVESRHTPGPMASSRLGGGPRRSVWSTWASSTPGRSSPASSEPPVRPLSTMSEPSRAQGPDARGRQGSLGHGVRAKRSKSGSISFDPLAQGEGSHAAVQ